MRGVATVTRISAFPLLVVSLTGWFPGKILEPVSIGLWSLLGIVGLSYIGLGFVLLGI